LIIAAKGEVRNPHLSMVRGLSSLLSPLSSFSLSLSISPSSDRMDDRSVERHERES